jgi:two-component system chemotaxis response regulator CheY
MPDINGLELISFVRSNPAYKDIPLIIVSTEKSDEDKKRGLTLGASSYIVKPFTKEQLMSAVNKVLKGAVRSRECRVCGIRPRSAAVDET